MLLVNDAKKQKFLKRITKMEIDEFNAFDIGQHYLKLQGTGMEDKDIGEALRRFVKLNAPLVAFEGRAVYGVELAKVEDEEENG